MTKNYILKSAVNAKGKPVEVVIESGLIAKSATAGIKHEIVDCKGLVVLPGFVDLHTHLREPGFEQ